MGRRALLAVLFLAIGLPAAGQQATARADIDVCLADKWPHRQLGCLVAAAKAADKPDPCLLATHDGVGWMCVATYAEHKRDPSLCAVIPTTALKPAGIERDLCRAHLAIAWNEAALCAGLVMPNLTDACYQKIVQRGGDKALCKRIQTPELNAACRQ